MASQTQWCIHAAVGQRSLGSGIRSHWVQAADKLQIRVFDFLSSGPSSNKMPLGVQQAVSWCSHVQPLPGLYTEARRDWGSWLLPPIPCAGLCSDSWEAAVWPQIWEELTFLLLKSVLNLSQHQCGPCSYTSQQVLFLKILLIFVSWNRHLFCCQIHLSADN